VTPLEPDYTDIQGLIRFGYRPMTDARYDLLRVRDAAAARAWLRSAPIASAESRVPPPGTALQVAFTAAGLSALGLSERVVAGFSHEFRGGIAEPSRARLLGDVGEDAPERWQWGYGPGEPHVMVMSFAVPGSRPVVDRHCEGAAWEAGFERLRSLDTSNLDGVEPFGFADGASQPRLSWDQRRSTPTGQGEYTNLVALGEFVLGYRNEYGKYTDRPLLDPSPASDGLPAAEDAPGRRDLGRNGTYLVLRQLSQDVRGFWRYLFAQSGGSEAGAERLASAMVGRTPAGVPLVPIEARAIEGIEGPPELQRLNRFTFDRDPDGAGCPIGAHIRRTNPRSADLPGNPSGLARLLMMLGFRAPRFRDDLVASARFHRLLRRGREYGPELSRGDALLPAPAGEPERGLHFICLNANLSRQFEFVQNAWVASTKFSGLSDESDPLLGNRRPHPGCPVTDRFTVPVRDGAPRRLTGLPPFVRVRGGAYFFLPGLRALRFLAADPPRA